VRILIFHGYLLRGTGSNVYNAELAQALSSLGHEVHLLSQDREAESLPWVDAVGTWSDSDAGLQVRQTGGSSPGEGSVTVYLPEIGEVLPVFVVDEYEGFTARAFPDLSDRDIDGYVDANVRAIREIIDLAGEMDAALANHLIAGPAICAEADLDFAIKVHGSDLSYAVIPHPERFVPLARRGVEAAKAVLVGSSFTARALWEVMKDPNLPAKTRLAPPGVDIERFRPRDETAGRTDSIERLIDDIPASDPTVGDFGRDDEAAVTALKGFAAAEGSRVVYVGKLLVNKGVDLLLAAWPIVVDGLVAEGRPTPRLLVVGFGSFEAGLRDLWSSIAAGDLDSAFRIAQRGRELEGEDAGGKLRILSDFLCDPPEGYVEMGRVAADSVLWAGRLDHGEVADVLPASEALVMPSTFPEAFGMVAAEAAACGVPFVSAAHSGMLEVSDRLGEALDPDDAGFLSFSVGSDSIEQLAACLLHWLRMSPEKQAQVSERLASAVSDSYSWPAMAAALVAAASGDLDKLPHP
jgi:glycosyltransferase involved in cell wall biosynthesis